MGPPHLNASIVIQSKDKPLMGVKENFKTSFLSNWFPLPLQNASATFPFYYFTFFFGTPKKLKIIKKLKWKQKKANSWINHSYKNSKLKVREKKHFLQENSY